MRDANKDFTVYASRSLVNHLRLKTGQFSMLRSYRACLSDSFKIRFVYSFFNLFQTGGLTTNNSRFSNFFFNYAVERVLGESGQTGHGTILNANRSKNELRRKLCKSREKNYFNFLYNNNKKKLLFIHAVNVKRFSFLLIFIFAFV